MSTSSDSPGRERRGKVRGYTVYRVDYVTGKKEAIGCILERREQEKERRWRGNLLDLLVEARRLFGRGNGEAINIVLDSPKGAREIKAMAISRGIVTITSFRAVGHGDRLRVLGDAPVRVGIPTVLERRFRG
jgi:hypothetical protein